MPINCFWNPEAGFVGYSVFRGKGGGGLFFGGEGGGVVGDGMGLKGMGWEGEGEGIDKYLFPITTFPDTGFPAREDGGGAVAGLLVGVEIVGRAGVGAWLLFRG